MDTTNVPIDDAFIDIAPIKLSLIFTGHSLLPAVTKTLNQTGDWDTPGQSRTVVFSDKSTARETLKQYERPLKFAYTVNQFTGILRFLIDSACGEWNFRSMQSHTSIHWTYEFEARSLFILPVVACIAQVLWRAYMKKALRMAIVYAEQEYSE